MSTQICLLSGVLLALCVALTMAEVTHPSAHNYDYPATVLLNLTTADHLNDISYEIVPGFAFRMTAVIYSRFWFHTDGGLTFDVADRRAFHIDDNQVGRPKEMILLTESWLVGERLTIRSTSSNVTIDYEVRQQGNPANSAHWIVTLYAGTADWVFDIDVLNNSIPSEGKVMTMGGASYELDTHTKGLTRYTNLQLTSKVKQIGAAVSITVVMLFGWLLVAYRQRLSACCQQAKGVVLGSRTTNEQPTQQDLQEEANRAAQDICNICMEAGVNVMGVCTHRYHLRCLKEWYRKSLRCPCCRQFNNIHKLKCRDCHKFSLIVRGTLPITRGSCCAWQKVPIISRLGII